MWYLSCCKDYVIRGQGQRVRVFWPGIFCWPTGKKEARKKEKGGENWEEKKENCKREGGKLKMEGWKVTKLGEDLFFFAFAFHFSKPLKFILGLPKWKFSTGKKHFTPGKKSGDFAPSEKFSCYTPACDHHYPHSKLRYFSPYRTLDICLFVISQSEQIMWIGCIRWWQTICVVLMPATIHIQSFKKIGHCVLVREGLPFWLTNNLHTPIQRAWQRKFKWSFQDRGQPKILVSCIFTKKWLAGEPCMQKWEEENFKTPWSP